MPAAIPLLVLLREEEILSDLRQAFSERYLPEHLFYWLPSSVAAWVSLCSSAEYKNASRALEVLRKAVSEISRRGAAVRSLCGIGCGEGSKDIVLLQEFKRQGGALNFIAADFSQALIEMAADQATPSAHLVVGCKLNVSCDDHLETLVEQAHSSNLSVMFSVLGNTLGAFDPKAFPARLRKHCRAGDFLLFDGEIFNQTTLGGYDNPTNRRFAWGPLTGVGITQDDGRLDFANETLGNGLFAVTKHFIASRDLRINVGGEAIEIRAGEKLAMSNSIKYRDESTLLGFVEKAGFHIDTKWASSDGGFVLALAQPG